MKEAADFSPYLIINLVVNFFSCYTTIMLNIVLIFALRRSSSLPKTLKALILSVAVSDLGIGLVVQPLYLARMIMQIQQTDDQETSKDIYRALHPIGRTLGYASFFGVTAISVDRFLAIHLHLKHQELLTYQELVTYKRVVAAVILSWLLSAFLALTGVVSGGYVCNLAAVTVALVCLLTMGLIYFKIYIAVRRHTVQVHAQLTQAVAPNEENRSNFQRVRKTAVGTFYVYLLFLACHLPIAIVILETQRNKVGKHMFIYTHTLLYLSSSLVPLVYCWKFRHIRCAIKKILRNIFASQNQIQEG
ncbi:adenosine receptor A3-like [Porites lutea]|uniref:adenosine receptor A3-like n=1 Tax=Porites lutea TaxID=51062 RepID=UPI003CC651D2